MQMVGPALEVHVAVDCLVQQVNKNASMIH